MDEEGVPSKLDFYSDEEIVEIENNDAAICERNDYYEELIEKNEPPIGLDTNYLRPIANKSILENEILLKKNHKSTLIPEYNITREFILEFLKNYKLCGMKKEDSDFLLKKYFNEECMENGEIADEEEERFEYNPDDDDDDDDNSDCEENEECVKQESSSTLESVVSTKSEELHIPTQSTQTQHTSEIEQKPQINESPTKQATESSIKKESRIQKIKEQKQRSESKSHEKDKKKFAMSSIITETFNEGKVDILKKNNISDEKIKESVDMKKYLNSFFKGELEKKSGIDKRATIAQYIKNNSVENFDTAFFNYRDANGDLIFDDDIINEWYDIIIKIEKKFETSCEFSYAIMMATLYGIEWIANYFDIVQFKNIASEMNDPTNLPKHLKNTNDTLVDMINDYVPKNVFMDISLFLGNVYMKNTVRKRYS